MLSKAKIHRFFRAIRNGRIDSVRGMIDTDPDLLNYPRPPPPKKDDGLSPLQVAMKTGQSEIAHLLLDRGADPCFRDSSSTNDWHTPVIYGATVNAMAAATTIHLMGQEPFDLALYLLQRVLSGGADPNARDTRGHTPLTAAWMQSRDYRDHRGDHPVWTEPFYEEDVPAVAAVYQTLLDAGADPCSFTSRGGRWDSLESYLSEDQADAKQIAPLIRMP